MTAVTGASERSRTRAERAAAGRALRADAPLEAHAELVTDASRDPIGLLREQERSRVPELVPLRHERMLVSPFTFFRGAALPMAADLARTPTSGLRVQLCGDAHLANFGAFASPERRLVFDLNDFDETLPGPFEWDVKRLAASLVIAARDNGFSVGDQKRVVRSGVEAYRTTMRQFARSGVMEVWYAHIDIEDELERVKSELKPSRAKETAALLHKARTRDSLQALSKLTELVDGRRRFISQPPVLVPLDELLAATEAGVVDRELAAIVERYSSSLDEDRRHLLRNFRLVDIARKVVGVGSVGTRAWVLLMDADGSDPLLLQAKEAQTSVLAPYAGASLHDNQGQRVVAGQRLMQAASDIFLGWQRSTGLDGVERDFYLRQLRDWKMSFPIERMLPRGMALYARVCAWTLARAHARSGDRFAIAAYLGGSDRFEGAVAEFAQAYADLTERDHAAFREDVGGKAVTGAAR
jgi:uncharacterized protein (DUF2252 family)